MPDLVGLRSKIIEKLRTISPHDLQVLAEEIALIRDPARYRDLYGKGRNREGQTVAGWPDAGVVKSDGTIDGVEATRDRAAWKNHLRDDLANAKAAHHPNLNGFLFVAGYPEHEPSYDEIAQAKKQFVDLGIPEERVSLLVGNGLVSELLDPKYARILNAVLGIAYQPGYFRLLEKGAPAPKQEFPFEPNDDEYSTDGRIYRPALTDQVERQLREQSSALVLGRGAAGKTVLAKLIAFGPEFRARCAWYVDLASVQQTAEAARTSILDAIVDFGGDGVLFIVDNAHLVDDLASEIYHHWNVFGRPSGTRLLVLAREVWRMGRRPLHDTDLELFVLRARIDEVAGVYNRIMQRDRQPGAVVQPPPREALVEWVRVFGGNPNDARHSVDLISFSAAVWRRRQSLARGEWGLSEADAAAEVRDRYLVRLLEGERHNLLRLASLPDDVELPAEALVDHYARFRTSMEHGVVFETTHGADNRYARYRLAHAALGRLLRIAAQPLTPDRAEQCRIVACMSPFSGFLLARHAWNDGERELARHVLAAIADCDWLSKMNGIQNIVPFLLIAAAVGVPVLHPERGNAELRATLLQLAFKGSPQFLVHVLQNIAAPPLRLSAVREDLVAALTDPVQAVNWLAFMLRADLSSVHTLLEYSADPSNGLTPVREKLVAELSDPRYRGHWFDLALGAGLHFLVGFLRYSANPSSGLSVVRARLTSDLCDARHRRRWLDRALRSQLSDLSVFLYYVQEPGSGMSVMRTVVARGAPLRGVRPFVQHALSRTNGRAGWLENLSADLSDPKYRKWWLDAALRAGLQPLLNFLKYAQWRKNMLVDVRRNLIADLSEPGNRHWWTDRVLQEQLPQVVAVLQYTAQPGNGFAELHASLVEELRDPVHRPLWVQRVRRTELAHAAAFLRYAALPESGLLSVFQNLSEDLARGDNVAALAAIAVSTPLEGLAAFLEVLPSSKEIVRQIDLDAWNSARSVERYQQPAFFINLSRRLTQHERPELGRAPARALIDASMEGRWRMDEVYLHQVGALLRSAGQLDRSILLRFLTGVLTPSWFEQQFRTSRPRTVALTMMQLAFHVPADLHAALNVAALQRFVESQFDRAVRSRAASAELIEGMSLVGAASLVGKGIDRRHRPWPSMRELSPTLLAADESEENRFGTLQTSCWAGLREMARQSHEPVHVPPGVGKRALDRWEELNPITPFAEAFNSSMIAWLARCRESGWVLRRETTALRSEVLGRIAEPAERTDDAENLVSKEAPWSAGSTASSQG